ncbi:uncharacterized protein AAG666_018639 [Megaptera novaeangliae]
MKRYRTRQTDPSKETRPENFLPPSRLFLLPSLPHPLSRLSCSPSFPPPSLVSAPARSSSRLSPPPPFLGQAFLRGARRLRVESAQRELGKACGAAEDRVLGREAALRKGPPLGLAGPGLGARLAGEAQRALGVGGEGVLRAGSGGSRGPGRAPRSRGKAVEIHPDQNAPCPRDPTPGQAAELPDIVVSRSWVGGWMLQLQGLSA